jgi:preprotein translocase subunit SecD
VLSRFRWFGSSRISGLGRVGHTRRPTRSPSTAGRALVGAGSSPSGTGVRSGGADRSTS